MDGWHLNYLRRYDEAIPVFQKLLPTGPNRAANHHLGLWGAYFRKGSNPEEVGEAPHPGDPHRADVRTRWRQRTGARLAGARLPERLLRHTRAADLRHGAMEKIINGRPHTVIGVMPRDFVFMNPEVRLWVPMAFTDEMLSTRHAGLGS